MSPYHKFLKKYGEPTEQILPPPSEELVEEEIVPETESFKKLPEIEEIDPESLIDRFKIYDPREDIPTARPGSRQAIPKVDLPPDPKAPDLDQLLKDFIGKKEAKNIDLIKACHAYYTLAIK